MKLSITASAMDIGRAKPCLLKSLTCWLSFVLLPCEALSAPAIRELRLPEKSLSTEVSDSVERGNRHVFTFSACKGQDADIRVSASESNVAITVWQPGARLGVEPDADIQGRALVGAAEGEDAQRWQGKLPASGRYLIVVGPTRGNATYRLTLKIEAGEKRPR